MFSLSLRIKVMDLKVSVIIPVYNAEKYIEKAIFSTLKQPEVCEVIVINDGSTDNTQNLLDQLKNRFDKVKVYCHENSLNKGRSKSRNLGIDKANGEFIAFLDADDYYLENRFTNDMKIFKDNRSVDGVYNAIGAHFYRNYSDQEYLKLNLVTTKYRFKFSDVFENLLSGTKGYFSIDGLTLRKSVFEKAGGFPEFLKVAEDTQFILKASLCCRLEAGVIDKAVANRGVHESNVFNRTDLYEKDILKMYESLIFWCIENNIDDSKIDRLLNNLWNTVQSKNNFIFNDIVYWSKIILQNPYILTTKLAVKFFPIVRYRKNLFPFLFKKNKR
jgi:glycosyltransferase involved in cell wall biosynthesis